jgi:Raf kinase inhibitor-like YbhB/YbcL family protein
MFDQTASFTHWGIYNVPPAAGGLPANAGNGGNPNQVVNDFGEKGYSGPCPPAGIRPETHTYIITLYALRTNLTLNPVGAFPANAETLYRALVDAAGAGKILGTASISGLYNSLPEP